MITPTSLEIIDETSVLKEKLLRLQKENKLLRKQQCNLQQTIEIFEQTNKVAKVGGWQYDLVANHITWTSVTREIHEVDDDYVPELTSAINFYKEGFSRDAVIKLVDAAIHYGTPYDVELILITAKGNEFWVRVKGNAEFKNGKCIRLYGVFQNIHAEKLKDMQLAQSREQFRQTFEHSTIGMSIIDLKGRWLKVNDSLCKMIGYTEEELQRMTFDDITPPEDMQLELPLFKKLVTGKEESYELEKKYIHKNGYVVWIIRTVTAIKNSDNKIVHLISQVIDISKRKAAEQIIREERELLRTLIDNIPVNIFIKNLQSQKTLVNKNELSYMGIKSEEEVLGKSDFELFPEESAKVSVEEDKKVFTTGEPLLDKETFNIKKDGATNWFLTSKIPLHDVNNNITGLLGISYDINERKEIEHKAKLLMDITNEQNSRLNNFAHIVSHNLRSHSANFATLLDLYNQEDNEEEKKELFKLLRSASASLLETVVNLNEIVEVNTNIGDKLCSINICDAINKVRHDIKAQLIEENAVYTNEIDCLLTVKAVPAYIESVFLNFFTNSLKYKSVDRSLVIKLTSATDGDFAVISFSDNGRGINLEKHGANLFGMYKTFHGNKDARGIGLFITKNQIEAMGGRITVESAVDAGTTFKIYFKLAQQL